MNHLITPTSPLASLIPALDVLAVAKGWPASVEYELADGQLAGTHPNGQRWAIRVDAESAMLHAQIDALLAAKKTADDATAAAAAQDLIDHPPVPFAVTRSQLFLWLYSAKGITRAQVRALITTEPGLIAFDEAQDFHRDHPLVAQLAGALGMSAADVDQGFRDAAKL